MDSGFEASFLFEGTCDTKVFNTWLEKELAPLLHDNHIVIMDNATFHKSQETRDIIKAAGCFVLFLPPYSPQLNPIEKLWANIKRAWKYEPQHSLDNILVSSNYIWN